MICPNCGYDMGNKSKCIRCGYEVKTLAVVDTDAENNESKSGKEDKIETKVIDPCNVFLTHPNGYEGIEDDFGMEFSFGDPFASLFGDFFGDPIGDLLGGLFGIDINPRRRARRAEEEPPKKKRKQGPIVEVSKVEVIKEDDSRAEDSQAEKQSAAEHEQKAKQHKNSFKNKYKK